MNIILNQINYYSSNWLYIKFAIYKKNFMKILYIISNTIWLLNIVQLEQLSLFPLIILVNNQMYIIMYNIYNIYIEYIVEIEIYLWSYNNVYWYYVN